MAKQTRLWYLVALVYGFLGGLLGYVTVQEHEEDFGKNLLIIGTLRSLVGALVIFKFLGFI
jgi:hypothetical protein